MKNIKGKSYQSQDGNTQFYVSFETGDAWSRSRTNDGWSDWQTLNTWGYTLSGDTNADSE